MDPVFSALHPDVAAWCDAKLGEPTAPQRSALPLGIAREHTLIASPTGTGKTLAAFLPAISRLAALRDRDELFARTYIVYISPLRALGYDVEHNVRRPLREMGLLERPNSPRAEVRRGRIREEFVRTGVRTGDTPTEERRLMMVRPPHILLTTPESLALMVAMASYRKLLTLVDTVIVDEVHALAANKRGSHLALVLEALEELNRGGGFTRIGLSATISPLPRVAQFLVGSQRSCAIVDERALRSARFHVEAPFRGAMASMEQLAQRANAIAEEDSTTLVFTNVRSQAERLAHEMANIEERNDVEFAQEFKSNERRNKRIGVHHSALERSLRHRIEAELRKGKLRTVVCSSSLELGVDIGFIDRVVLIGGARGMTPALQRIGRSGHRPGAVADGVILAQDRDDIVEAAATIRCIRDAVIEETNIPEAPLDVLAQWMVGLAAPDLRIAITDVLALARRAYPYRNLEEIPLRRCIAYLSGAGAGGDAANVRRIGADADAIYGLGREVSSAFYENVGTIPDERGVSVKTRSGNLGKVDESFAATLNVGDVFLLGGRSVRVKEIRDAVVSVEPHAARPTVPTWTSHMKGMPLELSREIGSLRRGVVERIRKHRDVAVSWLREYYALAEREANIVTEYIAQQARLSLVPDDQQPVIEIYEMDGHQTAVFHTCMGRRVNEVLARMVGARLFARTKSNSTLTTDDGGFLLTLTGKGKLSDDAWRAMLSPEHFERDFIAGLHASNLLRRYFRYVANTGLLVLRRAGGRTLKRGGMSWNSIAVFDRLISAEPDFPLVVETLRVVKHDLLDSNTARTYLEQRAIPKVVHPKAATPFTFGILTSSFADAVTLEDRVSMVEALHERVIATLQSA